VARRVFHAVHHHIAAMGILPQWQDGLPESGEGTTFQQISKDGVSVRSEMLLVPLQYIDFKTERVSFEYRRDWHRYAPIMCYPVQSPFP
jgi:hypothetical protein